MLACGPDGAKWAAEADLYYLRFTLADRQLGRIQFVAFVLCFTDESATLNHYFALKGFRRRITEKSCCAINNRFEWPSLVDSYHRTPGSHSLDNPDSEMLFQACVYQAYAVV